MIPFGAVLKKSPYSAVRAQPPKALPYHQDPDTKFPTRLDVNGGGIQQAVPVSVGVILPILFPPGLGVIFDKEVSKRLKSHPHMLNSMLTITKLKKTPTNQHGQKQ